MEMIVGQKWASKNEPELGTGLIIKKDNTQVSIFFNIAKEHRNYSIKNAPIMRIEFQENDIIKHQDLNECIINKIIKKEIYLYEVTQISSKEKKIIPETEIISNANLKSPIYKIKSEKLESRKRYNIRQQALEVRNKTIGQKSFNNIGAKIDLIPHQIWVAKSVSERFNPRVLLADEVGLGKTIEAGLIIYQQLITNKINRVLLITPESLTNQWFIEMYRKFNLKFKIYEQELIPSEQENPFNSAQLFIVKINQITDPHILEQIKAADWDMLVIDEAHIISYSETRENKEFNAVKALAKQIKSLLLLTATPDQLGHKNNFLRLQILDEKRFFDYENFVEEIENYKKISKTVFKILNENTLDRADKQEILEFINEEKNISAEDFDKNKKNIINKIIDYHGTSRILFRNSRKSIKGFQKRKLIKHPIADLPAEYLYLLKNNQNQDVDMQITSSLNPEIIFYDEDKQWQEIDKKINWLLELLNKNQDTKYLLICSSQFISSSINSILKKSDINTAEFNESMSIIQRDRAAANFADENKTQILVCSEIGSEGRNFQCSNNLICFDLPINHDLLEQRIGRVDRIGQNKEINIHIPYYKNTGQEILVDWYHNILNAFEQTNNSGRAIYKKFLKVLINSIAQNTKIDNEKEAEIKNYALELEKNINEGRDKILEISSSGLYSEINSLIDQVKQQEKKNSIKDFAIQMWDLVGLDVSHIKENIFKVSHSERTKSAYLDEQEEVLITFDRKTATTLDEVKFITEEHELIQKGIDIILHEKIGCIGVEVIKNSSLKTGTFFVELNLIAENAANKKAFYSKYMPNKIIKLVINKNQEEVTDKFYEIYQESIVTKENKKLNKKILAILKDNIIEIMQVGESISKNKITVIKQQSIDHLTKELNQEAERLMFLSKKNKNIREDEIKTIQKQIQEGKDYINESVFKIDSIKILTTINE